MALLICFIAKRQFGMPINYLIQDRHLSIQMIVNVVCISSSVESHMCRLIVCCLTHTLLALFSCFLSCLIRYKQIIIKPQSVHLCGVFEAFQILLPQTRNMKYLIENTYQIHGQRFDTNVLFVLVLCVLNKTKNINFIQRQYSLSFLKTSQLEKVGDKYCKERINLLTPTSQIYNFLKPFV